MNDSTRWTLVSDGLTTSQISGPRFRYTWAAHVVDLLVQHCDSNYRLAEDGVDRQLHLWTSQRSGVGVRSGISDNLLPESTTQRQLQRSQVASRYAFTANRRLTPVLTEHNARPCRILYQPKKQTRKHFLVPSRIEVSAIIVSVTCMLVSFKSSLMSSIHFLVFHLDSFSLFTNATLYLVHAFWI